MTPTVGRSPTCACARGWLREWTSSASAARPGGSRSRCSSAANLAGASWGLRGDPGLVRASYATYIGALAALGAGWERLRGGGRSRSVISRLTDPQPERWGRLDPAEVLKELETRPGGLRDEEVASRRRPRPRRVERNAFMQAMSD